MMKKDHFKQKLLLWPQVNTHNKTHEEQFHFSIILFMFLHLFMNKKNQRIICNIFEKNNEHFLFTSIWVNIL